MLGAFKWDGVWCFSSENSLSCGIVAQITVLQSISIKLSTISTKLTRETLERVLTKVILTKIKSIAYSVVGD